MKEWQKLTPEEQTAFCMPVLRRAMADALEPAWKRNRRAMNKSVDNELAFYGALDFARCAVGGKNEQS
jgi:hypothetical protein